MAVGSPGGARRRPPLPRPPRADLVVRGERLRVPADAPPQSVEKPPGSMSVTLMPNPATSWASAWLRPSSAHFEAWYIPTVGNAEMPPIEETCRMWPLPCARRNGSAAWVTHSAPNRLVSIWSRASCLADLLDHAELAVAGVVDDHVEAPEVLVRAADRVEHRAHSPTRGQSRATFRR